MAKGSVSYAGAQRMASAFPEVMDILKAYEMVAARSNNSK